MIVAALCGSGFAGAPALAQIDRGGASAAAVTDEMVVTASRREATVQEARTPARPGGAPFAETTINSALSLYSWLKQIIFA